MTRIERDSQIRTTAMVVLTFIAVAASLYYLREVLLPFVLALFIGSGLVPILNAMQKWFESSRAFAVFVTFLVSIAATSLLLVTIWFSVAGLLSSTGPYSAGVDKMLDHIGEMLEKIYPTEKEELPNEDSETPAPATDDEADSLEAFAAAQAADQSTPANRWAPLQAFFVGRMDSIIRLTANELISLFASGLLVMIFLFFMLLGGSQTKIPENNLWRDVDMHVREYIVTKTIISLVTAVLCGVVLWMFGVPLAFVLGMLVFLLNFIPNLGPIIANLLPVPLVWVLIEATWAYDGLPEEARKGMVDPDMSVFKGVLVIVLVGIIQFVSGNVFETKIMGDQFRLHPIAILLSLMFWYMIWGMVGAFLAVPITSALKIVFAELENTKPVADLLEGNLTILAKRPDQPATV
ncbi:AI-2E family transporter [Aeoliella sp. SH292]|uniref:AI-2E family transporter n=1 Tax=Aeoliella sp. SH292 TaxID=3454464 RepID=UPI003F9AC943